jgi:hypothetical protein
MTVRMLRVEERDRLRAMVEPHRAADAMACYYALQHPAARVRIWVREPGGGFLVRAQTGQDLFRPLVIMRARQPEGAEELLRVALPPGSAFLLSLSAEMALWPLPILCTESPTVLNLLELNAARFEPIVNIFVVHSQSPDGLPRYEIYHGDRLLAAAGVNWQSPEWAEIFVQTEPDVQNRGYGKSVTAALCRQLLEERRRVLFAVTESNGVSRRMAEGLGFTETGASETLCAATMADGGKSGARLEISA